MIVDFLIGLGLIGGLLMALQVPGAWLFRKVERDPSDVPPSLRFFLQAAYAGIAIAFVVLIALLLSIVREAVRR